MSRLAWHGACLCLDDTCTASDGFSVKRGQIQSIIDHQEVESVSQINVDPGGDRGGSGVNAVAVVAIVILVILAFLAVYFLFLGEDDGADIDADIDVSSPTTFIGSSFDV